MKHRKKEDVETLKPIIRKSDPTATNHGRAGCKICRHIDRANIERSWLLGQKTQMQISKELGCSPSLVNRHMRTHLAEAVGNCLCHDVSIK